MESLGIEQVFQGHRDKIPPYERLKAELRLEDDQIAYVGDDVVDLPIMRRVGLAIAVQDAHPLVKQHSHWQTSHGGGRGAARDVCEMVMEAQGHLQDMMKSYL
jgi:3-deoxy-D-manno-octulosonate 8-phosphate phosphatase (KDO 8-P phosphatase)